MTSHSRPTDERFVAADKAALYLLEDRLDHDTLDLIAVLGSKLEAALNKIDDDRDRYDVTTYFIQYLCERMDVGVVSIDLEAE